MKKTTMAAVAALSAAIAAFGAEPTDAKTHYAEDVFREAIDSGFMPGAIEIFYKNGVQETACLGWADVEAKRRITLDDHFMQCSQTKGFCGVTVAILVEEGKISLDDPVSKYLPEFKDLWVTVLDTNGVRTAIKASNPLTVRNAMNHTGGFAFELPNAKMMGGWCRRMPLRSVAATAAAIPLLFEPGTKAQYSNVGIDVGAAVVEVVSGMRWEEFLKARVLDPLGMSETTFWPTEAQLKDMIVSYECHKGAPAKRIAVREWMQQPFGDDRVFSSAGAGLWTTARDQLKFYKMLMNLGMGDNGARILKEETVKELLAKSSRPKGMGGYSLGLNAPEEDGEDSWFGHGGAWGTNCYVNWHKKELRLHVVQCGVGRDMSEKAAKMFFQHDFKDDSSAYTGRLK